MSRRFLLAILLAGCFSPTPVANAPCGPGDTCPSGQTCVEGVCRRPGDTSAIDAPLGSTDAAAATDAAPPDGPLNDVDADGIDNPMDNCPNRANPNQHDEDADAVGDVCDNCPHVANADQANTMDSPADAAGDVCDPRPTVTGDTIERFIGFEEMPADLVELMGAFSVATDRLVHATTVDSAFRITGIRDKVTVQISGRLDSNLSATTWMVVQAGEAAGEYHDCGYLDFGGTNPDFHTGLIEHYDGIDWNELDGTHLVNNRLSGAYTIKIFADSVANRIDCTTIDSRGTRTNTVTNATALVPGAVGVRTEGAAFRLDYRIVFGQL